MATSYQLTLRNESSRAWTFYVYPTLPDQHPSTVSLAWYVCPYVLAPSAEVVLKWTIDYGFVWQLHEVLAGGIRFSAEDHIPGDLTDHNTVTFSELNNTPAFSKPVAGSPAGSMVIHGDKSLPDTGFLVGITIGGSGAFLTPTGPNLTSSFTLENSPPTYWIAACDEIELGAVVDVTTRTNSVEVVFPDGVCEQVYSLNKKNVWVAESQ